MDNEKFFDDMLKEKAVSEIKCAPYDVTDHMIKIISNLPEKGCNSWLLRKFRSYKLREIIKDVIEVAIFAAILFMIPMLTVNHGKQDDLKNTNGASSYGNNKIKTSILNDLFITNIESVKEAQNGFPGTEPETLLPGKDKDKIENIIGLIRNSSDIRIADKDELSALRIKGGGPPYVDINMKNGKDFVLMPAMWVKKIGDNGGEYKWYEDRIILVDNREKQTFYTCYSKELVEYLRNR